MSAPEGGLSGRLRVSEVFCSLQGESSRSGLPTVFVRLTGCPLRCTYCDTRHAYSGGRRIGLEDLVEEVGRHGVAHVCVTGGEPLAQPACAGLLRLLCDGGFQVSLETGGSLSLAGLDPRVSRVLDLKTPGSGEVTANCWGNLALLTARDEVKFVLTDRADYDWARRVLEEHDLPGRCGLLFSAAAGHLAPVELAEWILADGLPVRFQLQLHRVLWGDARGR